MLHWFLSSRKMQASPPSTSSGMARLLSLCNDRYRTCVDEIKLYEHETSPRRDRWTGLPDPAAQLLNAEILRKLIRRLLQVPGRSLHLSETRVLGKARGV